MNPLENPGWIADHFMPNYTNNYMSEQCPKLLEKFKDVSKWEVMGSKDLSKKGQLRSLPINVSNFGMIFNQIELSERFITEMIWSLKRTGFEIEIEEVNWHNVMDSDDNILGNKGFFLVNFKII